MTCLIKMCQRKIKNYMMASLAPILTHQFKTFFHYSKLRLAEAKWTAEPVRTSLFI